jgi:RNA polymerase sigma-70 factor, ECF subfamily
LANAVEVSERQARLENPKGWLFRIAHNAALDLLRRRAREQAVLSGEELSPMTDPASPIDERLAAATALRTFMRLPVSQRSSVILMDVLGYSLEEIAAIVQSTVPAVKASLHRGRARLRELADEPDDGAVPTLAPSERELLLAYIDRFNARDFDAIRAMLAEEVRLDLVAKATMKGKAEVQTYFHNYSGKADWLLVPGFVERRPAILVCDPARPSDAPLYFVLLRWEKGALAYVRDFRYARYATEGAELQRL